MSTLIVPDDGDVFWPTLGWYVAEFLTGWDYLKNETSQRYSGSVFGPGSLKGERYRLDGEKLAAILRAYEVFPPEHRRGGRRRFNRVGISWRKGTAKTEWAAQIAYVELHPEGPVRFEGWDKANQAGDLSWDPYGQALPARGRAVNDPYIPMVAYNQDQTEELAYGALQVIVSEGDDAELFDVGGERILRLDYHGAPDGKAVALSSSPNANDGARTTFQHFDETHRMELPRLVDAHHTMLGNIPKRPLDDPWTLETTTAGRPGGGSVAEGTHKYAQKIREGKIKDPRIFFFHREASPKWDLSKFDERVAAIAEATGPAGEYAPGQFEDIAAQWDEPDSDKSYLERVWLNRWTKADAQAYDYQKFEALAIDEEIPEGALCTLGFDGARFRDSTAFVITEIKTGRQQLAALWERPEGLSEDDPWEVPIDEIHEAHREIRLRWRIHDGYYDPPHYVEDVAKWANEWPDSVTEWWTNRRRPMGQAARNYQEAINSGQVHPRKDPELIRHVGNAAKVETNLRDEEGRKVWILGKIAAGRRFDACMAAVLSWQARIDALGDGVADEETYVPRRLDRGGVVKAKAGQTSPDAPSPQAAGVTVRYGRDAVLSGR